MILAIRISGMVNVNSDIQDALHRLKLRRKYAAVLLDPSPELMKLLTKVRNFIAYGDIDKETLVQLIKKRGQPLKKGEKIDAEKIVEQLDKKDLKDLGLKPFFRLHPPIGGIDSKIHAGVKKGVLGDNKKAINDLVRRML